MSVGALWWLDRRAHHCDTTCRVTLPAAFFSSAPASSWVIPSVDTSLMQRIWSPVWMTKAHLSFSLLLEHLPLELYRTFDPLFLTVQIHYNLCYYFIIWSLSFIYLYICVCICVYICYMYIYVHIPVYVYIHMLGHSVPYSSSTNKKVHQAKQKQSNFI